MKYEISVRETIVSNHKIIIETHDPLEDYDVDDIISFMEIEQQEYESGISDAKYWVEHASKSMFNDKNKINIIDVILDEPGEIDEVEFEDFRELKEEKK